MRNAVDTQVQVVEPDDTPVVLTRITPRRSIRVVFWGLRVYIGLMVALVIVGFLRGMH
jgi:LPS O-antigen subunit length determinant protein (WzzB/FepE family)